MIKEFQGQYRWLSNFEPVSIEYEGITYPSVEHAYVSAKSTDPVWKKICSDPTKTSGQIKKLGRKRKLRSDWDSIKIGVMTECVRQKFDQEPFRSKLLATGTQQLLEGNWWGDKFWGVDKTTGVGENNLGLILMKIREELR